MTPSIKNRLSSMVHALTDIILPAIDSDNSLAREQAELVVAHLTLIGRQIDKASDFDRLELRAVINLGRTVSAIALGGSHTSEAADTVTAAIKAAAHEGDDRQEGIRSINHAIEQLIRACNIDGEKASNEKIAAKIIAHTKAQSLRDRVLFAATNFDAEKDSLPSQEEIL